MPFYECIVIARAGRAAPTSTMMKSLGDLVLRNGGNVRNINVLGDRILSKSLRGSDHTRYQVGRYVQFLIDANDNTVREFEKTARTNSESLRVKTFKIKDFYNEAEVFKRSAKFMSPLINHEDRNAEFLRA